jgi:hypothetical protein
LLQLLPLLLLLLQLEKRTCPTLVPPVDLELAPRSHTTGLTASSMTIAQSEYVKTMHMLQV